MAPDFISAAMLFKLESAVKRWTASPASASLPVNASAAARTPCASAKLGLIAIARRAHSIA